MKRSAEQLHRNLPENPPRSKHSGFSEIFDEDRVPLGLSVFILGARVGVSYGLSLKGDHILEVEGERGRGGRDLLFDHDVKDLRMFLLTGGGSCHNFSLRMSRSEDETEVEFVPQLPSGNIVMSSTISKCNQCDCGVSVFRGFAGVSF